MRNPFSDFASFEKETERKIPMDTILSEHEDVLGRLTAGFKLLVTDELGEGLWQPDGDSIVRVYKEASEIVSALPYTVGDIEAFTLAAVVSEDPDFYLMGPLGLYLSALCNNVEDRSVTFNLSGQDIRLPLLGYRMTEGQSLSVEGHLGDLVGISMEGGTLEVTGNVGRYLGAGMVSGTITVSGDAGRFIGEQMVGGEIHVQGRFGGVGKPAGGRVYHRKQVVYDGGK
jgi:hypothetical protein